MASRYDEGIGVPEPDLSMELSGQLKRSFSELQDDCSKESAKEMLRLRNACLGETQLLDALNQMWAACAERGAMEAVCMLQSFNPEISEERLTSDVHSIIHSDVVLIHLRPEMIAALRACVPLDRKLWLGQTIHRHLSRQQARRRSILRKVVKMLTCQAARFSEDSKLQFTSVAAAGGAVFGSAGGGALGLVAGSSFGALFGLVPALFTLGLSIPVGAFLGGGAGLCTGASAGGTIGLVGGGLAGWSTYDRRSEICNGMHHVWSKVIGLVGSVRQQANSSATFVKGRLVGGTGGTA
eukprot:TRINITY_DN107793_c0_g1_i1.p1 TRINITY_DN107793_c0_g1~~TRINITY_DN107793_c0_g1_i1.p1  ORF type:complete len:305 (+),score=66.50 TRINITY_DN107793_c0_g1_i1:28-915(+)